MHAAVDMAMAHVNGDNGARFDSIKKKLDEHLCPGDAASCCSGRIDQLDALYACTSLTVNKVLSDLMHKPNKAEKPPADT